MNKNKNFLLRMMDWLSKPKNNAPIFWACYAVCLAGILTVCILLSNKSVSKEQFVNNLGNTLLFMEILPMILMGIINKISEPVTIVKADKPVKANSEV